MRGEPINLTRSEFQVLRLLAENPGQVFSRKEIMEELWQTEFRGDVRACDVHISNLRQKVERDPQNPELVLTVRRVGYRFAEDGSSRSSARVGSPVLRLPEGDLAAVGRADHAAPACRALAWREQDRAAEVLRPLRRGADLGNGHIREPESAVGAALDDPAARALAEVEREVERSAASISSGRQPSSCE